ncbi:MAG: hypothetical protein ACI8RD_004129 [Bacillariaceae sp.]|jgi:hypothetical protein
MVKFKKVSWRLALGARPVFLLRTSLQSLWYEVMRDWTEGIRMVTCKNFKSTNADGEEDLLTSTYWVAIIATNILLYCTKRQKTYSTNISS